MQLIQFAVACCILVSLTSATHYYRRPIAYSKLTKNHDSKLTDRHDSKKPTEQTTSSDNKENQQENTGESNVLTQASTGLPLYSPLYLVPVKAEQGHTSGSGSGGAFGAFGNLVVPGLHLNLGSGNGFGGSLAASGGFSGHYGPNGHYGGLGGGHPGGYGYGPLVTPVHYGYGYPAQHYGGGGYGVHQGSYGGYGIPFYSGANGNHHKAPETPVNPSPSGPIVASHKENENQGKQPEVLFEVSSPYQQGEESVPGFHQPGFVASSAGRLGYQVVMASPEQLQELSLRQAQNPNPFVQFFQRPFQLLQMFVRPQNQNNTKQPEKPSVEKPVVESAVAGKPGPEKPVENKPSIEKPSGSLQGSAASADKEQGAKQNLTAPAGAQKKPVGSAAVPVSADKKETKEKPKPAAAVGDVTRDVIASVNEVVKATSVANAGPGPVLPILIDDGDSKAREGDDVKTALDSDDDVTDDGANIVPNDESPVDIESKPIA